MTASKALHKMTTEELGQLFPIIIQNYSEDWIKLYHKEKKLILDLFSPREIVHIDHIGSTAIPGLKSKPTIDILLQVSEEIDIIRLEDIFSMLGYELTNQPDNPPPRITFVKGYSPGGFKGQAYHVHIRYKGDWHEIQFRDYLIKHNDIAKEYETLKLKLAEKFRNNREAYTNSKTEFIEKVKQLISND